MRNRLRSIFTMALAVIITVISLGSVEVKAEAKALGKGDFVYIISKKKVNFIKLSKNEDAGYYAYASLTNRGDECKASIKKFKTSRSVKDGSSLAFVKKKYGEQKLKTISATMGIYKNIKYNTPQLDISTWKSYVSYSYKAGKNKYKLYMFFDKKNKVRGIVYSKNESDLYDYPNKKLNVGIQFKAPDGQEVKTENIGGKEVYLLPKGTTVSYDESYSKEKMCCDCSYTQYDVYGRVKAMSETDALPSGKMEDSSVTGCYLWNWKKDKPKYKNNNLQYIDMNNLGKYRYFTLYIYQVSIGEDGKRYAPQIVYFKFV